MRSSAERARSTAQPTHQDQPAPPPPTSTLVGKDRPTSPSFDEAVPLLPRCVRARYVRLQMLRKRPGLQHDPYIIKEIVVKGLDALVFTGPWGGGSDRSPYSVLSARTRARAAAAHDLAAQRGILSRAKL